MTKLDPYGHPVSVHNRTGYEPLAADDWETDSVLQRPKTSKPRGTERASAAEPSSGEASFCPRDPGAKQ